MSIEIEKYIINTEFSNIQDEILGKIESFFEESYGFKIAHTQCCRIEELLKKMRKNLSFVLEYPYIDKHHLDCYSTYFSTKFGNFEKDCIRVHIFEKDVDAIHIKKIYEETSIKLLKDNYLGFFILRPLSEKPLGRSLISPKAFVDNNFYCCLMQQKVSLCGIELNVYGFPHVAQDSETHTCAESAIWSLVNYYSSKYEDYRNISPSEVFVFIDDNKSPYQLAKFDCPTEYYNGEQIFKDMKIQSLIVPLPRYVYLEADRAMSLVRDIFETGKTSLKLTNEKWLTRLLLTNSRSYKSWIVKDGNIADIVFKKWLMLIKLPAFIWICEIYRDNGYANEEASGLLILDATGSNSLSSVLFYCLKNNLYTLSDDRTCWNNPNTCSNSFAVKTYKHNLRGEWSSWQL